MENLHDITEVIFGGIHGEETPRCLNAFSPKYDREICEIINSSFPGIQNQRGFTKYTHSRCDIEITNRFQTFHCHFGLNFQISKIDKEEVQNFINYLRASPYWFRLHVPKFFSTRLEVYLIRDDIPINPEYLRATGWFY